MTATIPIRMPQLGLTMTEGMLIEWCCNHGDEVSRGDILYVVETDKIANEIEADRDGTLGEMVVSVGDTVEVGTILAYWADGDNNSNVPPVADSIANKRQAQRSSPKPAILQRGSQAKSAAERIIATPHARMLAREKKVDLTHINGSGPKGRIKAQDVLAAIDNKAPALASTDDGGVVSLSLRQKGVGLHMQQSKQEIPHFYLVANAEISELLRCHDRVRTMGSYHLLTLNHWVVCAVGTVLHENPQFRVVWNDGRLQRIPTSDVAVAVAVDDGLVAPVARDVGRQSLSENSSALAELAERSSQNELGRNDVGGASLCVSNIGRFDIQYMTPIIIPGQSAILGVGRAQKLFRPDASDQPELRHELGLVLACDHRVFNGTDGADLLTSIVAVLEDPLRILVGEGPTV